MMDKQQVTSAIGALNQLFFSEDKNQELGFQTLEFFVHDLKFLKDIDHVAKMIEQQQAYALLAPIKLLDFESAERIEVALSVSVYTDAELIAMDKEFEDWKNGRDTSL
jgi:hypothetical protein